MPRQNTQVAPIILSSAAAKEMEELLPSIGVFGDELNRFIEQVRKALHSAQAINSQGVEALIQIVVYPPHEN